MSDEVLVKENPSDAIRQGAVLVAGDGVARKVVVVDGGTAGDEGWSQPLQ